MAICRFFQQGYCRYGNNCRFEHENPYKYEAASNRQHQQQQQQQQHNYQRQPQQPHQAYQAQQGYGGDGAVTTEQMLRQVETDALAALHGRQWILSCYSPFRSKPNFPGMDDASPEEMRLRAYEARANGNLAQVENEIGRLRAEATEKMRALTKPDRALIDVIERLYRNETPADPFRPGATSFAQNAPSAFGAAKNSAASSLFASAAQTLFQNESQPFGGGFATNPPANSAFGNGFGQPTFPQPVSPTNGFSQFGQSGPQQPAVSPSALFASANMALQQQAPAFGQNLPMNRPDENPFLSNSNDASGSATANPFGGPASNPFGSTPSNPFGSSSNPFGSSSNPFGTSSNSFGSSSNPFGSSNPLSNGFGQDDVDLESVYSKIEELTEEEIAAYKSDSFRGGRIPKNPPTLEMCK